MRTVIRIGLTVSVALTLVGCGHGAQPGPVDGSPGDARLIDAGESGPADADAMPPENDCESDADCEEGERCDEVMDGEFTHRVCICDSTPDICDGRDNDCDPSTPDGSDEESLGQPCDGGDDDLCEEGAILCVDGVLSCDDDSESREDICDGVDNDCNPDTTDGADEATLGAACDGEDDDLCTDGSIGCVDGELGCSDDDVSVEDLCDGVDNDCNPMTPDGADESTLSDSCDGADADLCHEGIVSCTDGALGCTDMTGDDLEVCNGADDDCDGMTDEGCAPVVLSLSCNTPCRNALRLDTTAAFDPTTPRWYRVLLFEPSMTADVRLTTSDTTGVVFECRDAGVVVACGATFSYTAGTTEGVRLISVQARRGAALVMDETIEIAVYPEPAASTPALPGRYGGDYMLRTLVPTQTKQEPDHVWIAGGATLLIRGRNFCIHRDATHHCTVVAVGGATINVRGSNVSTRTTSERSDFVVDSGATLVIRGSNFFPELVRVGLNAIVIRQGTNFRATLARLATPGLDVTLCPFSRTGSCPPGLVFVD